MSLVQLPSGNVSRAYFAAFANKIIRWNFAELAELIGAPIPTETKAPIEARWTEEAREEFERTYGADLALWGG
jgi:hypothetical protein